MGISSQLLNYEKLEEFIRHAYLEMDGLFSINDIQFFLKIGFSQAKSIIDSLENLGICKLTTRGRFAKVSLDKALKILRETGD